MSSSVSPVRGRVPRFAEAAVARARLTVVPRQTQKAPRVPFLVLVSLVLVCGIGGLLLFDTSLQQASFTATSMEQRANMLDAKAQALQLDLARLRAPQRLAERAKALGMLPPSDPAFLRLSDGKVLGKPAPASPADAIRINPLPARKPADLQPPPIVVTASSADGSGHHGAASADPQQSPGRKGAHHRQQGSTH